MYLPLLSSHSIFALVRLVCLFTRSLARKRAHKHTSIRSLAAHRARSLCSTKIYSFCLMPSQISKSSIERLFIVVDINISFMFISYCDFKRTTAKYSLLFPSGPAFVYTNIRHIYSHRHFHLNANKRVLFLLWLSDFGFVFVLSFIRVLSLRIFSTQ